MHPPSDCPDLRFAIEWGAAREYEAIIDDPSRAVPFMLDDPEQAALWHYVMFYALAAGDVTYGEGR